MSETALKIRLFGDPVLRKKAKKIKSVSVRHQNALSAMARLMYDASGIGLAAPQVGISEAMIVVDIGNGLYKLVNPEIIKKSGSWSIEEGCLSVPGVGIKVKRAKEVVVRSLDENGKAVIVKAQDLLACVLQHEIDHLYGKTIVDHASILDKIRIAKTLECLKAKAKKNVILCKSERESLKL